MDNTNGRGSSRARGRIAEVLADARASLMEPSRPFTPASLDQRTALGNTKSIDKYGSNLTASYLQLSYTVRHQAHFAL
jgi:hypothetical protein